VILNDKFWSICAMPIGIMLCFGPCVIAWLISGTETPSEEELPASTPPPPSKSLN
jgi:hypothetical protein